MISELSSRAINGTAGSARFNYTDCLNGYYSRNSLLYCFNIPSSSPNCKHGIVSGSNFICSTCISGYYLDSVTDMCG